MTGLFPVPLMRISGFLDAAETAAVAAQMPADAATTNAKSDRLSHSAVVSPGDSDDFAALCRKLQPRLVDFGSLLFGENLDWLIKEMWLNRLQRGGFQSVHSHANSFISGVVYLTATHASARTVFYKSMGGREFTFANEHRGVTMGPFNAPKWATPAISPGDMVLFPSYLLHEVPPNEGDTRMTLAFNAVPARLRSWDYELRFAAG